MKTVADLIKELQELPPEMGVVLSKDGEGNSYSPYCDMGTLYYQPTTTWFGEGMGEESLREYAEEWYWTEVDSDENDISREQVMQWADKNGYKEVICLWPVN